jgi:hypothetical protein
VCAGVAGGFPHAHQNVNDVNGWIFTQIESSFLILWVVVHVHIKTRTPLQIKPKIHKEHEDAIARGDVVAEQKARRLLAIRSQQAPPPSNSLAIFNMQITASNNKHTLEKHRPLAPKQWMEKKQETSGGICTGKVVP